MSDEPTNSIAFHLIGETAASGLDTIGAMNLRPALYAGFEDLSTLRHDFPVVLGGHDDGFVRSLTDIFNDILREIAPPGVEGEYARNQILRLEREIRVTVAETGESSLSKAWDKATGGLVRQIGNGSLTALKDCFEQAREVLDRDGRIIDCTIETPMAFVGEAWAVDQMAKGYVRRKRVDELIQRLENILGAEVWKSKETLSPENLKGSVGASFENAFDFDAMSDVLTPTQPRDPLPDDRRRRIVSALHVLRAQKFFKSEKWSKKNGQHGGPYSFFFKTTASALKAMRDRMPEMVELAKAISVTELEISNRYDGAKHDAFFAAYDESSLLPEDIAFFPTYLVALGGKTLDIREKARILELLSSGLAVKVLAQVDDILANLTGAEGQRPFGGVGWQLASMAVGLNNIFVLQASGANLYRLRDQIRDGLAFPGPALFSVFSGGAETVTGVPPYLAAAAATESRAFPTFFYNPAAGSNWASRMSVDGNPQRDRDWPVHRFSYEDADLQRRSEDVDFTFIDFVLADRRFAKYFARLPDGEWTDTMVPVGEYLEAASGGVSAKVPCLLAVDENSRLHRLVVDDRLIRAAGGCRDMWHSLREMGGVHNSHALGLLERERALWRAARSRELAEMAELEGRRAPETDALVDELDPPPAATDAIQDMPEMPEVCTDDPRIETPRCTTCNECTQINARMFEYDDNKQAYIADVTAGTYRQLVEAAENCQVSIIHPGKPRDRSEPNLEELMERAEPFN